jgi:DNA-binding NtrC family response regulator
VSARRRADLLYRLHIFPITLPPAGHATTASSSGQPLPSPRTTRDEGTGSATAPALVRLRSHPWPGNVRELRNVVHRAFIVADEAIGADALPLQSAATPGCREVEAGGLLFRPGTRIVEVEKVLIVSTLDHFDGDKKRTAEALGISLKTLYNRLNEYGRGRNSLPPLPAPQPRETAGA